MKTLVVRDRQTILDLSIREAGTIEAVFELASENGISITEMLSSGVRLHVPDLFEKHDREVKDYYFRKTINPATAPSKQQPEGLDYEFLEGPEPIFTIE